MFSGLVGYWSWSDGAGVVVAPTTTPVVGGAGDEKPKRRRILVKIDDQVFEVDSAETAHALLFQAMELAKETAEVEVQKQAKRKKPQPIVAPRIEAPAYDPTDELTQQVRAQVEAAQAVLNQIYARAQEEARERREQERNAYAEYLVRDEEEATQIMAMVQKDEDAILAAIMDHLKKHGQD